MNRWYPFKQLYLARLREFYREPVAIFWVYGFPLLMALVLGVAFMGGEPDSPIVDVQDGSPLAEPLVEYLKKHRVHAEKHDATTCQQRLQTGKTMLVVVPTGEASQEQYEFRYDQARPDAVTARYQVEALLQRRRGEQTGSGVALSEELVKEPGTRYIDFLIPGLIGLNVMGGGLWGVGFVLVDFRVRKLMKRLLATPMNRGDFLRAILAARMTLLVPDILVLGLVGYYAWKVPMRGDLLTMALVVLAGSTAFSGLGLLIACRTEKMETVSGLMNLVMLPMWLLSGTFFRSTRFPEVVQPLIQALPLTQLNNALREVMLEGASLTAVAWRIGILLVWGVVTFALALKWFRWQ